MYNDLKQLYWWSGMKRDISEFVARCLVCQQVKAEHQVPSACDDTRVEMDRVTMDFVSGLPLTLKKKDAIWVVVDRLTKLAHLIPIVRLHGVAVSIISDKDLLFTSQSLKICSDVVYYNLKAVGGNICRWLILCIITIFNRV
ncbi:integrase [Gossypium australe]|uniref:Integrase n=1 Tax=Gossypium australe TaxID=47621 RepID=A0A5B6VL56_9ROSI|nr:integrase [Gossypium australe]